MSLPHGSARLIEPTSSEPTEHPFSPATLATSTNPDQTIGDILAIVREFTGADVAYIGEFRAPRQIVRWSSGDSSSFGIRAGVSIPLADSFCSRLVVGEIPGSIPDVRADERTRDLVFTEHASVGSYLGTTVSLSDGRFFGTMCALGHRTRERVDPRNDHFMELIATIVAQQIERAESLSIGRRARFDRIRHVLDAENSVRVALQPILDLDAHEVVGYEALARFADGRSPDHWFAEAWGVELGLDLELKTLLAALTRIDELPPGTFMSVNTTPQVFLSASLDEELERLGIDGSRVVLELTEHAQVTDYQALRKALAPLRARGFRIAVDDAGAGFASLRHVLNLQPDIIKLDVSLTRGIGSDPARAALAALFASFAARIGATVVAEGIEGDDDLTVLRSVGIPLGQGYLLGPPEEISRTPDVWETTAITENERINAPYLR